MLFCYKNRCEMGIILKHESQNKFTLIENDLVLHNF